MKLISLNMWGGTIFDPLMEFIRNAAADTDIFCFQEVFTYSEARTSNGARLNLFTEIKNILPAHRGFFQPIQDGADLEGATAIPAVFGQAIFVHCERTVEQEGFSFTYRSRNARVGGDIATMGAGFQHLRFTHGSRQFTVLSLHGISRPGDKLDTPDRIEQSKRIIRFIHDARCPVILCGDFNLMPTTQSIRMLEEAGLTNLIAEFDISETRGKLSPFYGMPGYQKFADYTFVSPDIRVHSFAVPGVSISDHLPMILEFS